MTASVLGVACPSETSCVAVGSYRGSPQSVDRHPVVGGLSGGNWSIVPGPVPPVTVNSQGQLASVACATVTRCFGVGVYLPAQGPTNKTLIEQWNGSAWTVVASPNPARPRVSQLFGIACPTSTSCFAVGSAFSHTLVRKTLVEHWDGHAWSIVPSPNAAQSSTLLHVSCVSDSSCFAVGWSIVNSSLTKTLVERWNGTAWSVVASANVPGAVSSTLADVSCPSATECFAVGESKLTRAGFASALVERWNGTRWSIVPLPAFAAPVEFSRLFGISCPAVTSCFAVGSSLPVNGNTTAVVEHWDGTSWSLVVSPALDAVTTLVAISCASVSNCVAFSGGLIEKFDGTGWTIVPAGGSQSNLTGVSCSSMTQCFAVGDQIDYSVGTFGVQRSVLEQWDGTRWTVAQAAAPPGADALLLSAVACPAVATCFGVGTYERDGVGRKALLERWDGTAWSIVASPDSGATSYEALSDISCSSPTSCFAVGGSDSNALTERWDGTRWAIVASPIPSDSVGEALTNLSCSSSTGCLAVGVGGSPRSGVVLVERWDGSHWSIIAGPAIAGRLTGISCWSDTNCFAVDDGGSTIERWNGTTWSDIVFATRGYHPLTGISCSSGTSCIAVGSPGDSVHPAPYARWDGKKWSLVAIPAPARSVRYVLSDVDCVSAGHCFAVGSSNSAISQFTLAERYS